MDKAHPLVKNELTIKFKISILPNYEGKTIFHLCKENNNFRLLNNLLHYLKLYSLDHHSRFIKPFISDMIEKNLSNLKEYLNSRMLQNE